MTTKWWKPGMTLLHTFDVVEIELITDKHNMGKSTITVHETPVTTTVRLTFYTTTNGPLQQQT